MDVSGYWLDSRHMIAPLKDEDSTDIKYYLMTFENEVIDNVIDAKWFTLTEIDLANFEWEGKSYRIELTN